MKKSISIHIKICYFIYLTLFAFSYPNIRVLRLLAFLKIITNRFCILLRLCHLKIVSYYAPYCSSKLGTRFLFANKLHEFFVVIGIVVNYLCFREDNHKEILWKLSDTGKWDGHTALMWSVEWIFVCASNMETVNAWFIEI